DAVKPVKESVAIGEELGVAVTGDDGGIGGPCADWRGQARVVSIAQSILGPGRGREGDGGNVSGARRGDGGSGRGEICARENHRTVGIHGEISEVGGIAGGGVIIK